MSSIIIEKIVLSNIIMPPDFADGIKLIPSSGTVLGGTAVRIITPCVRDPQNIKCRFGNRIVEGSYIISDQQFLCVTPEARNYKVGQERFVLTFTDGGKSVTQKSKFYRSESYSQCTHPIIIRAHLIPLSPSLSLSQSYIHCIAIYDRNVSFDSRGRLPIPFKTESITLYWNPDFISSTNPQNYHVNIKLYELTPQNGVRREIKSLLTSVPNSGSATVKVPKIYGSTRAVILAYFQVTLAATETMDIRQKFPTEIPTQWIFVMLADISPSLITQCKLWLENEPAGTTLMGYVEPCPPREDQASGSNSNFEKEDFVQCFVAGEDIEKALNHDFYHRNANVCYTQRTLR